MATSKRSQGSGHAKPTLHGPWQALYLSKNPLASLAGAGQFAGLRCLGASDCGLAALGALDALAPLAATLQAAAFEGCPLAVLPHYREHVRACTHTGEPDRCLLAIRGVLPGMLWHLLAGALHAPQLRMGGAAI